MAIEDQTHTDVTCCECHKPIPSIPAWLATANVRFECEECRSKHPRMPGVELETRRGAYSDVDEVGELGESGAEAGDEEESEESEETEEYAE